TTTITRTLGSPMCSMKMILMSKTTATNGSQEYFAQNPSKIAEILSAGYQFLIPAGVLACFLGKLSAAGFA
ncbi:MAG: hypothetical protein ACI4UL_01040, partial [Muribaculaceae bacterium]